MRNIYIELQVNDEIMEKAERVKDDDRQSIRVFK